MANKWKICFRNNFLNPTLTCIYLFQDNLCSTCHACIAWRLMFWRMHKLIQDRFFAVPCRIVFLNCWKLSWLLPCLCNINWFLLASDVLSIVHCTLRRVLGWYLVNINLEFETPILILKYKWMLLASLLVGRLKGERTISF